jgi:hypothetical protein
MTKPVDPALDIATEIASEERLQNKERGFVIISMAELIDANKTSGQIR